MRRICILSSSQIFKTTQSRLYTQTAFITGGSTEINIRTLEQFIEFDHQIIIGTDDVNESKSILSNDKIDWIHLDITNDSSIISATKHIQSNYDTIDILINNALIDNGPGLNKENINKTFDSNYYGNINMTEAMLPYFSTSETIEKDTKNLSVYSSRIIFPFNRDCALNKLSKPLQNALLDADLTLNGLNDLINRFKDDCIGKKWNEFGWIMNTQLMSIVFLNMFARIIGKQMYENRSFNHWLGSFCLDFSNNTMTQNSNALYKLSTMLIDDEDKDKNGCLYGAFFKAATNIDVDDDDGYVDEVEVQILDWVNPRSTISWDTMLDDLMFSNVTGEDQ